FLTETSLSFPQSSCRSPDSRTIRQNVCDACCSLRTLLGSYSNRNIHLHKKTPQQWYSGTGRQEGQPKQLACATRSRHCASIVTVGATRAVANRLQYLR